ncbi:MAG TPA: IS110 family transposase [Roseiflexaceae bacterium]|jgi:transposase
MEVLIERCCGLDVHQAEVVAAVLIQTEKKRPEKVIRRFRTVRDELEQMRAWLLELGVTHVGMESTGVYWMPVYMVLEDRLTLIVGNATHIRNVPGRKTDVNDAEWIAHLVRHGLIRPSMVPDPMMRELREYTRYRRKLVEAQATERNRVLRLLETAGIKLASFASDVFGVSGRRMLAALAAGAPDPADIAELAKGTLRRKRVDLTRALRGDFQAHHRFLLQIHLRRIQQIETDIALLDQRIDAALLPVKDDFERLQEIPGIDRICAAVIIAELGVDMSHFPSAGHAAAWAGVCPGNNESAGKRKTQHARRGNVPLKTALTQAAVGASKAKGTYYRDKYWRLRARRGAPRAAMAIAHKLLIAAYHVLASAKPYKELGALYLDTLNKAGLVNRMRHRLEALGFQVTLTPNAA